MSSCLPYLLPQNPENFGKSIESLTSGIGDAMSMTAKYNDVEETGMSEMDWLTCCKEPGLCLGIWCCAPCVYSHTVAEMKGETCEAVFCGHCLLQWIPCVSCLHMAYLVEKLREQHNFKGSSQTDLILGFLCCIHAPLLAVMTNEVGNFPDWLNEFDRNPDSVAPAKGESGNVALGSAATPEAAPPQAVVQQAVGAEKMQRDNSLAEPATPKGPPTAKSDP